MQTNIYIQLTDEFNTGRLRTIICSGQAAVLHRLAIMSKDGDWILREDEESCRHVLNVLEQHGAHYRFGAPLDIRWLTQGWSSHFEFPHQGLRVRTDFFTRPPRISDPELSALWQEQAGRRPPFVNLIQLAKLKQTDREKDYAIIGELARRMTAVADQLLFSRSALDLLRMAEQQPDLVTELARKRPVLALVREGRDRLEAALDAERRQLIHANEKRLARFEKAAEKWKEQWSALARQLQDLPLAHAHSMVITKAEKYLTLPV